MTDNQIRAEWRKLMRPLEHGHATPKMVTAFDELTSQLYGRRLIDWLDFIEAQQVIADARRAAEKAANIEAAD